MYAVLFSKKLEIYSVESEQALHCIEFDTQQTDFCFLTETALIVADNKARLTLLTNVDQEEDAEAKDGQKVEGIKMKLLETGSYKIRSLDIYTDCKDASEHFVVSVSKQGAEFWNVQRLLAKAEAQSQEIDQIFKVKPCRSLEMSN